MHRPEEKILAAILEEARASGIAPTLVALIERIYYNQQELSQSFNGLQSTLSWERQRTEKWFRELEMKIAPEAAAKRKITDDLKAEKASGSNSQCVLGTL